MGAKIRIVSGLVLFLFVTSHLLNVSLGLKSIALMDAARPMFMAPWVNPLGSLVLALSLISHFFLGLSAIYRRNTLRMSSSDTVQMAASLAVVPLLTPHIVGTSVAAQFGIEPSFASLIPYFWIDVPLEGLRQVLLLTILWVHGCIGVYTWARIQIWWQRIGGYLYPLAVAVPVLGLLGFVNAGNEAIQRYESAASAPIAESDTATSGADAADAAAVAEPRVRINAAPERSREEVLLFLKRTNWTVFYVYLGMVGLVFAARHVRLSGEGLKVRVAFAEGPRVESEGGLTLLEIARENHVPLAHLCRGRGRCGTCRVRILESADLPPMHADERATLERVGAGPHTRLACQLKPPAGFISVERILPAYVRPRDIHGHDANDDAAEDRAVLGPAEKSAA